MRGGPSSATHHAPQSAQPQPPTIGHGPSNLFGGIMAGGRGEGLAAPPQEPPQPQGLPAHLTQGSGLNTGPPQAQHQPYSGYQSAPGVNGSHDHLAHINPPGPNAHYGAPPHPAAGSPGLNGRSRMPPGAATPQQPKPSPYPGSPRSHVPTPPPGRQAVQQPPLHEIREVGNELSKLDIAELPASLKREGDDWWAIFNPRQPRRLDISLVHTLTHESVVCCVRFSHDGRYVATGCNHAAQIYDVSTGEEVAHLEERHPTEDGKDADLYIRSVCFSPDGRYLATGAEDKIIRVWDIATKTVTVSFEGHEQDIYSLDYSANGRIIASGSGDRTVRLWDVETRQSVITLAIEEGVTTVALSRDGRLVAAGSLDRSVRVWQTEDGMILDRLEGDTGHSDSVYSVAFSPSGRELVSGSLDKTIKMWKLSPFPPRGEQSRKIGECIRTFTGHSDFVLSVALTPNGRWVLSGSKDRGVQFWDPDTGHTYMHLQGHRNSVISVAPSPTSTLFATGSGDSKAKIWRFVCSRGPPPLHSFLQFVFFSSFLLPCSEDRIAKQLADSLLFPTDTKIFPLVRLWAAGLTDLRKQSLCPYDSTSTEARHLPDWNHKPSNWNILSANRALAQVSC